MLEEGKVKDLKPRYSQEYVTALLTALKLEQEQSAYYERHMWDFHGLAESESQRAEAAEQRLQHPIRQQHAEWSNATFGNVGPVGPLKHLAKEAREAAAAPDDLLEWADMQFLLWDAQRRAGITDDQMIEAMERKLPILKARKWPEPKDGEPRFHIKIES
ncbi:TPA: DUF550 domain-containing protein [Serratia fonticola]|nr:DUF550 domain-containing protein [Serratia fonticola]HBE9150655.1 DUF550 domain-containing protein [Serratia fonticola]